MKIKVNRRYLTRDNEIAFVFYNDKDNKRFIYCVVGKRLSRIVSYDGKYRGDKKEDGYDLVSPYKPRKREPKVGDRVKFETTSNSCDMVGRITKIVDEKEIHVDVHTNVYYITGRQIVRFLNKEKV